MGKVKFIFFIYFFIYSNLFADIDFFNKNSKITLGSGTTLYFANSNSTWDGTLEKRDGSFIQGSSITFDHGILEENDTVNKIIGTYSPTADRKIILDGNKTLKSESGTVSDKINIVGSGNKLQGQPIFSNTDSIRLENENASLNIAVQNSLNSDIELRNGTVNLDSDLRMADDMVITGSGIMDLQGHSLKMGGKTSLNLTHTIDWYNATDVNLNSKIIFSGTWNINGNQTLRGNGNILDLTSGGTIYIKNNATLNMTDVVVKGLGLNNGWIDFQNDTGTLNLSNVVFELVDNYNTQNGTINSDGPTTVIVKNYDWTIDNNALLSVDGQTLWLDPADYDGTGDEGNIRFGSPKSTYLSLVSSGTISYIARGAGLPDKIKNNSNAILTCCRLTKQNSNAIVQNDTDIRYNSNAIVSISLDSDLIEDNSNAIVSLENCCDLVGYISDATILNNQNITNNSNAIVSIGDDLSHISSATIENDNQISWNSSAIINLEQDIINNSNAIVTLSYDTSLAEYNSNVLINLVDDVENNSNAIVSLSECCDLVGNISNATIFNDQNITNNSNAILNIGSDISHISSATIENDNEISWNSSAILQFASSDLARYNSNSVLALQDDINNIARSEADHILRFMQGPGDVGFSEDITFSVDMFLSSDHRVLITSDMVINGSSHFIDFSNSKEYLFHLDSNVTVTLQNIVLRNISDYSIRKESGAQLIFGEGTVVNWEQKSNLTEEWICHGDVVFNGNENRLELSPTGKLTLLENSNITLCNLKISGLQSDNLSCYDNSCSVILIDSSLILTNTFNFKKGSFLFDGDVNISGPYVFSYESSLGSTINSYSSLLLSGGLTFSYDPVNKSRDLLTFQSSDSILFLDSSTFYVCNTGIDLVGGKLWINGISFLSSEAYDTTTTQNGITFGNGNESDDLSCLFLGDSMLELEKGIFTYNNKSLSSWYMQSVNSVFGIGSGATLNLLETINFDRGTLVGYDNSTFARMFDAQILGSVFISGNVFNEILH